MRIDIGEPQRTVVVGEHAHQFAGLELGQRRLRSVDFVAEHPRMSGLQTPVLVALQAQHGQFGDSCAAWHRDLFGYSGAHSNRRSGIENADVSRSDRGASLFAAWNGRSGPARPRARIQRRRLGIPGRRAGTAIPRDRAGSSGQRTQPAAAWRIFDCRVRRGIVGAGRSSAHRAGQSGGLFTGRSRGARNGVAAPGRRGASCPDQRPRLLPHRPLAQMAGGACRRRLGAPVGHAAHVPC